MATFPCYITWLIAQLLQQLQKKRVISYYCKFCVFYTNITGRCHITRFIWTEMDTFQKESGEMSWSVHSKSFPLLYYLQKVSAFKHQHQYTYMYIISIGTKVSGWLVESLVWVGVKKRGNVEVEMKVVDINTDYSPD